jgi:hypothetical protein
VQTVNRYGTPVVSQLVYDRTKEQRDFWKERAEFLDARCKALEVDLFGWLNWFGSTNQRSADTRKLLGDSVANRSAK